MGISAIKSSLIMGISAIKSSRVEHPLGNVFHDCNICRDFDRCRDARRTFVKILTNVVIVKYLGHKTLSKTSTRYFDGCRSREK
jgi:hypothetical protein